MLSWSFCLLLGWGQLYEKDVRDPQAIHITLEPSSNEEAMEKGKYWAATSKKTSSYELHNLSVQHDLWYIFSKVWCLVMSRKSRHQVSIICTFIKTLYTSHLQQLCLHGSCDGGRVDELEGRCSIIGVLDREHHQHPDPVVAAVHRDRTAATHGIHLWGTAIAL